jgi:hypothetical protein
MVTAQWPFMVFTAAKERLEGALNGWVVETGNNISDEHKE